MAAIEFLDGGRVLVDFAGEIQAEYRNKLSASGQPGVADRFYQQIIQSAPGRIERIELAKRTDGSFADFPTDPRLAKFDRSDRRFAALARKTGAPVPNATNSDWLDHRKVLREHEIEVHFLGGCEGSQWYAEPPAGRRKRSRGG